MVVVVVVESRRGIQMFGARAAGRAAADRAASRALREIVEESTLTPPEMIARLKVFAADQVTTLP